VLPRRATSSICVVSAGGNAPPSASTWRRIASPAPFLICRGDPFQGEWCSIFSTWVWRQAQVQIPIYAWSGDPYSWAGPGGGINNVAGHHTYVLSPSQTPRPGDMVFFGSGPNASVHVAVILQVLPSHALVVMNGNDYNGQHADGYAGESTFFPSSTHSVDGAGPVYGYASPINDRPGGASSAARGANAPSTDATNAGVLTPAQIQALIKTQDPGSFASAQRRQARRRPAFQHMPYVSRRITIEVANYRHTGKLVLDVFHSGSRRSAARSFKRFIARYRDNGRTYVVHYEKRR